MSCSVFLQSPKWTFLGREWYFVAMFSQVQFFRFPSDDTLYSNALGTGRSSVRRDAGPISCSHSLNKNTPCHVLCSSEMFNVFSAWNYMVPGWFFYFFFSQNAALTSKSVTERCWKRLLFFVSVVFCFHLVGAQLHAIGFFRNTELCKCDAYSWPQRGRSPKKYPNTKTSASVRILGILGAVYMRI